MKKSLFLAMFALCMGFMGNLSAQNCEYLVLPHVGYNSDQFEMMPQAKVDWYCIFSHQSFIEADEVPTGVVLHSLTEVRNLFTGEYLPANLQVDLDSLSFYAYNFDEFVCQANGQRVYFLTPGSTHPYLVLRTHAEAMEATNTLWETHVYDADGNLIR